MCLLFFRLALCYLNITICFHRASILLTDCNLQLISQSESVNYFNVTKATWDVLEERGSNDKLDPVCLGKETKISSHVLVC
jgi:hypothetical protein